MLAVPKYNPILIQYWCTNGNYISDQSYVPKYTERLDSILIVEMILIFEMTAMPRNSTNIYIQYWCTDVPYIWDESYIPKCNEHWDSTLMYECSLHFISDQSDVPKYNYHLGSILMYVSNQIRKIWGEEPRENVDVHPHYPTIHTFVCSVCVSMLHKDEKGWRGWG